MVKRILSLIWAAFICGNGALSAMQCACCNDGDEREALDEKTPLNRPVNWPAEVIYVSSYVTNDGKIRIPGYEGKSALSKIEIRYLPEGHRAYVNQASRGVFCKKAITNGEIIGEYAGLLVSENKSKTSRFLLKHSADFSVDAEMYGNETRFINDYRGVTKEPNVIYITHTCRTFVYNGKYLDSTTVIKAIKNIEENEELTVNYGKGYCEKWKITD